MMDAMTPRAVLLFCAPLASGAAVIAALAALNHQSEGSSILWVMISRLAEVMLLGIVGMLAAYGGGLKGSVIMTASDGRAALQAVLNQGVLPGLVLGVANYLFFFYERYSPFVEERIREISTIYDATIVSLDTGILEEVIYRLFVLSSLLFLFAHLYRGMRHVQPRLVSILPPTMAIVLSSLLFASAHSVTGFTAAFTGGIILGFIYVRSGVESAIAAHFAANLFFFSAAYLL
jgi:membrane protease YdiL (CAAX protease family)